jgi:hypothetical protein
MKTFIELRESGSYTDWRKYLIDGLGDLRALTADVADKLYDESLNKHDSEMIDALEMFFGG